MHTQGARKHGETEQRLYLLERLARIASLLCPTQTSPRSPGPRPFILISETHAPDDVYENVRAQFSEAETVLLTMGIATVDAWNRLAISFRAVHPVEAKAAHVAA